MIQPIKIIAIFVYRLNEGNPHIPGSLSATLGYQNKEHLKTLSIMDAEQFLRKHFGLKGEYYTEAFKEILAIKDEKERESAMDDFLDDETIDCQKQFTREAWAAWEKALEMFRDLEKEGYYSPEYKAAMAIMNEDERYEAFDAILDKNGPEGYHTKGAWEAWQRALNMVDDLVSMGIFSDKPGSPAWDIRNGFCDLSCGE